MAPHRRENTNLKHSNDSAAGGRPAPPAAHTHTHKHTCTQMQAETHTPSPSGAPRHSAPSSPGCSTPTQTCMPASSSQRAPAAVWQPPLPPPRERAAAPMMVGRRSLARARELRAAPVRQCSVCDPTRKTGASGRTSSAHKRRPQPPPRARGCAVGPSKVAWPLQHAQPARHQGRRQGRAQQHERMRHAAARDCGDINNKKASRRT